MNPCTNKAHRAELKGVRDSGGGVGAQTWSGGRGQPDFTVEQRSKPWIPLADPSQAGLWVGPDFARPGHPSDQRSMAWERSEGLTVGSFAPCSSLHLRKQAHRGQ